VRDIALRADPLENILDRGEPSGARETADEDVVAGRIDLGAECQRIECAPLADDSL
jgi:hypothetical protein